MTGSGPRVTAVHPSSSGSTQLGRLKYEVKRRWMATRASMQTLTAYWYDCRLYLTHSSTRNALVTRENLGAKITERYHDIEKGLSLPQPRPAFGLTVIPSVVRLVDEYAGRFGSDHVTRAAVGALVDYRRFNLEAGVDPAGIPCNDDILRLQQELESYPAGTSGVRTMQRDEVLAAVASVGLEFFQSRHSTRIFADRPVTDAELDFALAAAMTAPAVCNREFSSATFWTDPARVREILALQGGARGFGDQLPALAMVTISRRTFWSAAERNQGWIDGGMFAMNLILGLHAQGLGAVPLNWSKGPRTDRAMKALLGLAEDRAIIMFIGLGHLDERYRVAASPRRDLEEFRLRRP